MQNWIIKSIFFFSVHVEDIILHMFQYIQKLRTEGPQEWVFQECKVSNSGCTQGTVSGGRLFTNYFYYYIIWVCN